MNVAAKDYGKSRISQILEIFRLALGIGHLTPREYYDYRLFDDAQFSFSDKQRFTGQASEEEIKKILINDSWRMLSDDKFLFATLFRSQAFPLARILATYNYGPNRRACWVPSLNTADDLKSFLRNGVEFPLFAKPIVGRYGIGCIGVEALDHTTGRMILANKETVSIDRFIERLGKFSDGYMFQEMLRPHRVIRDVCGDRIATVRLVVLVDSQHAKIQHASWKIPSGRNMVDNFSRGQIGNLLAAVNIDDGRIKRIVCGLGVDQQQLEYHPETGKRIQDLMLPCWPELKGLCLEAAMLLPGFRLQAWDIAICDEGPVLLEVQPGGVVAPQIASQQGMLDDHFLRWLGSINKLWQWEVTLSALDQAPRKIYRRRYPKRNS